MSLVSPEEVRALISTSLSNDDLQVVINRVEAEINARIGAPQDDQESVTITKTLIGEGENIFLPSEVLAIVSVVEKDSGYQRTLTSYDYRVWGGGVLERLPEGTNWEDQVLVTYKPADNRLARQSAIIDLVRLDLNRTAMHGENFAGEYSYTAVDFEKERKRIIRRLAFPVAG